MFHDPSNHLFHAAERPYYCSIHIEHFLSLGFSPLPTPRFTTSAHTDNDCYIRSRTSSKFASSTFLTFFNFFTLFFDDVHRSKYASRTRWNTGGPGLLITCHWSRRRRCSSRSEQPQNKSHQTVLRCTTATGDSDSSCPHTRPAMCRLQVMGGSVYNVTRLYLYQLRPILKGLRRTPLGDPELMCWVQFPAPRTCQTGKSRGGSHGCGGTSGRL